MLKYSIVIIIFLLWGGNETLSLQAEEAHHQSHSGSLARKVKALYEFDRDLKATWSYETLTVVKATSDSVRQQSLFTYGGYLQCLALVITWHNSPQILSRAGRVLLPTQLQKPYETAVACAFGAAHAYTVYMNPLRQSFGYTCGLVSAYLMLNGLERIESNFLRKELQGFTYFCCREAGWAFYDFYDAHIIAFLQKASSPFLSRFFSREPSVKSDPELFFRKKRKEVSKVNDNVTVMVDNWKKTTVIIPECEDLELKKSSLAKFNSTLLPPFLSAYQQAAVSDKKLYFFMGDDHFSCNCYWQKREMFKWAKVLGIKHVYVELTDRLFSVTRELASDWVQFEIPYKNATEYANYGGGLSALAAYLHAKKLNLTFIPVDEGRRVVEPLWETATEQYFKYMQAYLRGEISRTDKLSIQGHSFDFTTCPHFEAREEYMIKRYREAQENYISTTGAAHLGGIYQGLKGVTDAVVYMANCALPVDEANSKTVDKNRASYFTAVFGKECGERYSQSVKYMQFYRKTSKVIQSSIDNDIRHG